jgi:hypothetical protein
MIEALYYIGLAVLLGWAIWNSEPKDNDPRW